MKRKECMYIFPFLLVLLLPGCRYETWLSGIFNQGNLVDNHVAVVQQYLRIKHVYDQFLTLGHFDVIWLSNEVRIAYSQVYADKHCLSNERYHSFLRRQLEENKHFISFYILSAVPASFGKPSLSNKNSEWALCLHINGVFYQPIEIKELDELPAEYVMFYGKTYSHHKKPFLVRFDANDLQGCPLIHPGINCIELWFNRVDRKVCMGWQIDSAGNVIRKRITDPDVLMYDIEYAYIKN